MTRENDGPRHNYFGGDHGPGLECNVELIVRGLNHREILRRAAAALRATADKIASGDLEDGLHDIIDVDGKTIGTFSLNYFR